jgi:hypothetical protein
MSNWLCWLPSGSGPPSCNSEGAGIAVVTRSAAISSNARTWSNQTIANSGRLGKSAGREAFQGVIHSFAEVLGAVVDAHHVLNRQHRCRLGPAIWSSST